MAGFWRVSTTVRTFQQTLDIAKPILKLDMWLNDDVRAGEFGICELDEPGTAPGIR